MTSSAMGQSYLRLFKAVCWFLIGLLPAAHAEDSSVLVETATIKEQLIHETLTAYGTLDPDPDLEEGLSLPRSGLINRVWVGLGQRVKSGDRLLELVTSPEAFMQYLQAKNTVDFSERELQRQRRLLNENMATSADVDTAQKNLHDAKSTLKALEQRGQGIPREIIRAPMDGIITSLDVKQGQRITADTTVMFIGAQQRLIVRLGVEPEDLSKVQVGSPVIVKPVFVPDIELDTQVREVHAVVDPATRLVEVLAAVPAKHSEGLILGSRVSARIQFSSHRALVAPRSAVLFEGSQAYVFVVEGGRARRVPVTAGTDEGKLIAIKGQLNKGDMVVVTGNYELTDGAAVREPEKQ